jgi:hypothetical protein
VFGCGRYVALVLHDDCFFDGVDVVVFAVLEQNNTFVLLDANTFA